MTRANPSTLAELDPEIERTLRDRRAEHRTVEVEPIPGEGPELRRTSSSDSDRRGSEPTVQMADQQPEEDTRSMAECARDALRSKKGGSSIVNPRIEAHSFQISPHVVQMLKDHAQFDGLDDQNPHEHLERFLKICDMQRMNGVSDDAINLRLFPFSLGGKALKWLTKLPPRTVTTWEGCVDLFIQKFLPPSRQIQYRNDITHFRQAEGETIGEAWSRFDDLQRLCPSHGLDDWMLAQSFYDGVLPATRQTIDASAGGCVGQIRPALALKMFENLALSSEKWHPHRSQPVKAGMYQVSTTTALEAKVDMLAKKLEDMATLGQGRAPSCAVCGGSHLAAYCPGPQTTHTAATVEQVDYVGNRNRNSFGYNFGNPYGNTYNERWKDHPNFSYKNPVRHDGQGSTSQQVVPHEPHQMVPAEKKGESLSDIVTSLASATREGFRNHEQMFRNQQATLNDLSTQLAQVHKMLAERTPGSLPSNTETNPRENVQAITLRSGRETAGHPGSVQSSPPTQSPPMVAVSSSSAPPATPVAPTPVQISAPVEPTPPPVSVDPSPVILDETVPAPVAPPPYQPHVPYPAALRKECEDDQFRKFLDLFKQLHINIPFI